MQGSKCHQTSVDENGDLLLGKGKVGLSGQRKMSSPAGDLAPLQKIRRALLRRPIARWPDTGHDFGALGRAEDVGHGSEHLAKKTQIRIFWGSHQQCAIQKAISFFARSFREQTASVTGGEV